MQMLIKNWIRFFVCLWLLTMLTISCGRVAFGQGSDATNPPDRIRRTGGQVIVNTGGVPSIEPATGQGFDIKGGSVTPPVSTAGRCRAYYSTTSNTIRVSCNGGAYVNWAQPVGGVGTVQSVGLSVPNIFTVSGSPVTTTGTLAATLANQVANAVWASPNGATGTPTFRALVANDIPALDAGKIASGIVPPARGGTGLTTPFALADILYADTTTTWSRLAGNNTTTREFLQTTGNNTNVTSFSYVVLAGADIPPIDLTVNSSNGGIKNVLPIANGGTALSAVGSNNNVLAVNGSALAYKQIFSSDNTVAITHSAGQINLQVPAVGCPTCGVGQLPKSNGIVGSPFVPSGFRDDTTIASIQSLGEQVFNATLGASAPVVQFGDLASIFNKTTFALDDTTKTIAAQTTNSFSAGDSQGNGNGTLLTVDVTNQKITSNRLFESTSGGFKFPDGSTQTSAVTSYENPLTFNSPLSRSVNMISCPTCVVSGGTGEQLLATVAGVNMNTTAAQDLYTVPGGKTLIVTRAVIRNASADLTGCTSTTGFNVIDSGAGTTIISFNLALMNTSAKYAVGVPSAAGAAVVITAGNKAQFKPTTACGGAATTTIDLFGYTF